MLTITRLETFVIGDGPEIDPDKGGIEQHVDEVTMVFRELVPDRVHLDVHHVPPDASRDFHTLITTGMSSKPMTVPEGAEPFQLAELVMCLPANWKLSSSKFAVERICLYPEGIAPHSPGLPANAGYPGMLSTCPFYPERVSSSEKSR